MVEERKEPAGMGQPQDSMIMQLINNLNVVGTNLNNVTGQDLVKEFAKKYENLGDIEREVLERCKKI